MIRTSWVGIGGRGSRLSSSATGVRRLARELLERPPDLVDGDHAAQYAFAVDGEQGAKRRSGSEHRSCLERGVGADRPVAVVGDHELAHGPVGLGAARWTTCSSAGRWMSPMKRRSASTTGNHDQPW